MITKVISGMQTGADQGGLFGAEDAGVSTGGTAPKNYYTENGSDRLNGARFGIEECKVFGYPARTRMNVEDSNGTIIIGNSNSPGCRLTKRLANELNKPCCLVMYPRDKPVPLDLLVAWIRKHDIDTLNVAGNRESTNPGIFIFTRTLIRDLCVACK